MIRTSLGALSFGVAFVLACGPTEPPKAPPPVEQPKACTQEAKLCPDGTAVSRTGPDCEFAPCPDDGGVGDLTPTSTP